jgi:putative SOS response-associated peptidase YedK
MCGRYELSSHPEVIALAFGLPSVPQLRARYNIAPTQQVPIVRTNRDGARELVEVRWGLVPRWARDPSIGARMINARAETVATNGAFRFPYAHHRCLVPVNGFYEWRKSAAGKIPHHVGMRDHRPFALAGLYERWRSGEGEIIDSVAIVTREATGAVRSLHDRMPVIVAEADYARWLDRAIEDVGDLLDSPSREALVIHPVATRVNSVANDDASLIEPVAEPEVPHPSAASAKAAADDEREPELPLQTRLL